MFEDKTAIVTGAARGIGRILGTRLLERNCRVAAFDLLEQDLEDFKKEADAKGWRLVVRPVNVCDESAVVKEVDSVLAEFGAIDFLVNNAGIVRDRLLPRMSREDWEAVLRVNLDSVFLVSRAIIRPMMRARRGRIVSVSSVVALMGNPGQTNYGASKAGIIGFSRSLALEVASRGITVNVVAPGFIDTDMTRNLKEEARKKLNERIPAGRLGTPDDVAAAVLFLLSDGAAYITGQVLEVNGGMHLG